VRRSQLFSLAVLAAGQLDAGPDPVFLPVLDRIPRAQSLLRQWAPPQALQPATPIQSKPLLCTIATPRWEDWSRGNEPSEATLSNVRAQGSDGPGLDANAGRGKIDVRLVKVGDKQLSCLTKERGHFI
jgi:hypothetical protein